MLGLALNPLLCLQYALDRHVCMQTASGFHLILISLLGTLTLFLQAQHQLCLEATASSVVLSFAQFPISSHNFPEGKIWLLSKKLIPQYTVFFKKSIIMQDDLNIPSYWNSRFHLRICKMLPSDSTPNQLNPCLTLSYYSMINFILILLWLSMLLILTEWK